MEDSKQSRSYALWMLLGGIVVLLTLGINRFVLSIRTIDVSVHPEELFPDGKSTATVRLIPLNALKFRPTLKPPKFRCTIEEGADLVTVTYGKDSTFIEVHAKDRPGTVLLLLHTDLVPLPVRVSIRISQPTADMDRDGYPDAAELTSAEDRRNFRRWFTCIAESQYYRIDQSWLPDERDCAGLLRFACREALRAHDHAWLQRRSYLVDPNIPDVRKFRYPFIPLIGSKLYRIRGGAFSEDDLTGIDTVFSAFAEARLLKEHTFFLPGAPSRKHCPATSSSI